MKKKKKLVKPVPQVVSALDWGQVRDWIKQEYKRDVDDWEGKFTKKGALDNDSIEYHCFWHWILDKQNPSNNSYFSLSKDDIEAEEQWVQDILNIIFEEFAEHVDKGVIQFHVWW